MRKKRSRMEATEVNEEIDDLENIDMNEMTDSEDEYSEHECKLLKKVRNRNSSESCESDYEVYGVDEEHEGYQDNVEDGVQTDTIESDIERAPEDFDLPNEKAWGKKKKSYYFTDYVDADYATTSQKQLAEAEMEEEEARNIQKRLAEQLDDADFGLDIVESGKVYDQEVSENKEQLIKTDLSKLNKRQKQALMHKESPEFSALVNDFKERMSEVKDVLGPFLTLANSARWTSSTVTTFVNTKYHLLLNYCINISFYLMLKAKRLPVNSHPVIKRLAQYRQLINQLESEQGNIIQQIHEILVDEKHGKTFYNLSDGSKISFSKQKTSCFKKDTNYQTGSGNEIPNVHLSESESEMDENNTEFIIEDNLKNEKEIETQSVNTVDPIVENESKRAITYQIAKNKGLTPHRKKEQRNPRVKHRNKYRKAKIRRKGAVREVRKEVARYAGEISGIKAGVKKSIKLK